MTAFVWVVAVVIAVDTLVKVACLAVGRMPERTPCGTAVDVVCGLVMLIWAGVVLS